MLAYDRDHIDQTVAAILDENPRLTRVEATLRDAEKRLRRHGPH